MCANNAEPNPNGHQFEQFDLAKLVKAYDAVHAQDPASVDWNIAAVLDGAYLGGSDDVLLGGSVASSYASQGYMGYYTDVADTMKDPQFGMVAQSAYGGMIL